MRLTIFMYLVSTTSDIRAQTPPRWLGVLGLDRHPIRGTVDAVGLQIDGHTESPRQICWLVQSTSLVVLDVATETLMEEMREERRGSAPAQLTLAGVAQASKNSMIRKGHDTGRGGWVVTTASAVSEDFAQLQCTDDCSSLDSQALDKCLRCILIGLRERNLICSADRDTTSRDTTSRVEMTPVSVTSRATAGKTTRARTSEYKREERRG